MNSKKQLPRYIESLQSEGNYWFLGREIQKELGLSEKALNIGLWRLGQKHAICRIRGDFYVIVPPEHRTAGCLPAHWFIDPLMKYLRLPYYIALLSAASIEGAAHQQIMLLQIITIKPLRKIMAGNQQIQFYSKPIIDETLLDTKKTPLSYYKISKPELTAFDLVKYAKGFDQLQQAVTVIYELIEKLDIKVLEELVNKQKVPLTSAQRLGYLLEAVIETDLDLKKFWIAVEQKKPRYIPLVTGATNPDDTKNQRWHIIVNQHIELDSL